MLKIFDSNAECAAINRTFMELKCNNTPESRHILITPDRFSLSVEQKVFQVLGLDGAFQIEVFSFTNFARRALKTLPRCLSKEGTVMLLKEVIEREVESLQYYRNVKHLKTFPRELFAVIASIRNSGISPDDLQKAFEGKQDLNAKKYLDIAHIYRAYQEELQKKYIDTTGRLDALIEGAHLLPEVVNSHFYLVGFLFFNKKQWQIIEALTAAAKSVNISTSTFTGGANDALFSSAVYTNARAIKQRTGTELVTERLAETLPEPLDALCKNIFSFSDGMLPSSKNVTLFYENTPYDEVKAVGREIARLVRREGYRYRDIAILVYDDSYKGVARDIFDRFQIPYFFDQKYLLNTVCSVRYLFESMQVLIENFRRKTVLNFVKNPLFSADKSAVDGFENYILKYNIDFNRFLQPFTRGAEDECAEAEAVRLKLMSELPNLLTEDAMVKERTQAVRAFFSEQRAEREAEIVKFAGDTAYQNLHMQARRLMAEQLDELDEVTGERMGSLSEFKDALQSAVLSVEISLIPQKNDCVFIGTGEESALFDVKALFILGAADGIVPKTQGYQAIMPEKDILQFERMGLKLYPTPIDRLREDKARLINLMTKAEQKLYVSYAAYNLAAQPMAPSEFLKELLAVSGWQLTSLSRRFELKRGYCKEAAQDFLVSEKNAKSELLASRGTNARQTRLSCVLEDYFAATLKVENKLQDFVPERLAACFLKEEKGMKVTSASQLETYAKCPYLHFFRYGLRLKPREESDATAIDVGSIIHKVLEIYFKNTLGRLPALTELDIVKETAEAVEAGFCSERAEVLWESGYGKILYYALKEQMSELLPKLTRYAKKSQFQPLLIEHSFSASKGSAIPLSTRFGTVAVNGKIDRVDTSGDQAILIDYKTGQVKLDYTNAYYGCNVQLFLYALPLRDKGYRIAGSYYLKISDGYTKAGHTLQFLGNTVNSTALFPRLDRTFEEGAWESECFPIKNKITKEGVCTVSTGGSKLVEESLLTETERLVLGTAQIGAEEILSGYVAKRPIGNVCDYCDYRVLCDDKKPRKPYIVQISDEMLLREAEDENDE